MLAPLNPRETPSAKPLGQGSLSLDQPFGAITLPVALTTSLRLSPDQFEQLCLANPEAVLELAQDGHLIAMTPTGGDTGARNGELFFQIKAWARAQGGWMAFDSSTGFRLPDDAVLSPDTSLVALDRWQALTPEQRRRIPPLCPDLVVELASPSDEGPRGLTALRQKMAAYQRNGARLGWLLIPQERSVEVWGPLQGGEQGRRIEAATRLEGDPVFPGLVIDLLPIWAE
ncbi:MAG: Uma2 family endonuclease [Synechococcaceae cyanobacterium]|nr:Uma2 family endonuclease [Synechococcaceae cyanobacterium]